MLHGLLAKYQRYSPPQGGFNSSGLLLINPSMFLKGNKELFLSVLTALGQELLDAKEYVFKIYLCQSHLFHPCGLSQHGVLIQKNWNKGCAF